MQAINECLKRTTDENLMGKLLNDALDIAVKLEGKTLERKCIPLFLCILIYSMCNNYVSTSFQGSSLFLFREKGRGRRREERTGEREWQCLVRLDRVNIKD